MQEQEREMMLRQEQTKQQYMQQHPMYPGAPMYNPYYPPGAYGAPPGSQPGKILFGNKSDSMGAIFFIRA